MTKKGTESIPNKICGGVAKKELELEDLLPIKDFAAIHDPLQVRVFFLQGNLDFLLVSLEFTSLPEVLIEALKEELCQVFGIELEHIWISVTHTFSAPHIRESTVELKQLVIKTVVQTVHEAQLKKRELQFSIGRMISQLNVNRNVETDLGWWLGANEEAYSNHEVQLLKVEDKQTQEVVLVLFNYDVQASVMINSSLKNGGRSISADFTGEACRILEKQVEVAISLPGAAGDQRPIMQACEEILQENQLKRIDQHEAGFKLVQELGNDLAEQISVALEQAEKMLVIDTLEIHSRKLCLAEKIMPIPTKELKPCQTFDFSGKGTEIELTITGLLLGKLFVLGLQPEINSSYGQLIRACSPYLHTMIITLLNGAKKYLPEPVDYQRITYPAMNSPFAEGSSDKLLTEISNFFQEWQ